MDGVDSHLSTDAGRGITNANAHYQWVAGGDGVSAAAGFVGKRMAMLSTCASREKLARLYAAVSVAIAAVGRANAGWVDGIDPKLKTDAGRGVSDANAHYQWVAGGANLDAPGEFVGQRMTALSTTVPRNVYAKVYSDVSVLIARCGTTGQCGQ